MRLNRLAFLIFVLVVALVGCSKKDDDDFSRVDYNKDGKLIFEELIVVFPDLTVEEFLAADADHNGSLDTKEYARFRETRRAGKKLETKSEATPQAPSAQPETPAAPAAVAPDAGTPPASAPATPATAAPASTTPDQAPATQTPVAPSAPAPSADASQTGTSAPAPAAQSPVPSVPTPGEAVEVVPATPAPESAPAAAKTYVVARGDNLLRIAKRFGVSLEALMEANGLKNADRVDAGATLTIPAPDAVTGTPVSGGTPAPAAVTTFVADFFGKSARGDVNALVDDYADTVNYYKKGKSGRDIVRQDKVAYFERWPKRTYTPGAATVAPVTGSEDLRVTVPVAYTAARGDKTTSGQAVFTFLLRPEGQTYRIVGEQSVVGKRGVTHR